MDLSLPIIGLIAVSGYMLNDKKNPRNEKFQRKKISPHETPSGKNIYTSDFSKEINKKEQEIADIQFAKSRHPKDSNIIPPLYNSSCTWGCEKNISEVTVMSDNPLLNLKPKTPKKKKSIFDGPMFNNGINQRTFTDVLVNVPDEKENFKNGVSSLTGGALDTTHENMVPFFGSNVTQNIDLDKGNQHILDAYTGISFDFKPPKKEVDNLHPVQKQQVFGSIFEVTKDRFTPSKYHQGIVPVPEIKVQPLPGSYVRPKYKNVDNLRVKLKPKTEFLQPFTSGKRFVTERGVSTPFVKNRPKKFYEFTKDRYLVTTGEVKGSLTRISKNETVGTDGLVSIETKGTKQETLQDWIRNASSLHPSFGGDKDTYKLKTQEREDTNTEITGLPKSTVSGLRAILSDAPKITNKEMNIYEYSGVSKSEVDKPRDYSSAYSQTKFRQINPENEYVTPGSRTSKGVLGKDQIGSNQVKTFKESIVNNSDYTYNGVINSELSSVGHLSFLKKDEAQRIQEFNNASNVSGPVTKINGIAQIGPARQTNDDNEFNFADRTVDPRLVEVLKNNPIAQEYKF